MESRTAQRTHILKRIRLGYNPRGTHDEEHVNMLMLSVKELGILEPLLVIAVNDGPNTISRPMAANTGTAQRLPPTAKTTCARSVNCT